MRAIALFASIVLVALAATAAAQPFPTKPLILICPWPAGGTTDTHLRKFAEVAAKYLGQPVLVENKPGGGGMVGPAQMARLARPDGYTVSQLPITAFRLPHQRAVDWDALNDFTYIIGITGYTFGIVVRADSSVKNLRQLIDYARANPGQLAYATPGAGTSPLDLIASADDALYQSKREGKNRVSAPSGGAGAVPPAGGSSTPRWGVTTVTAW